MTFAGHLTSSSSSSSKEVPLFLSIFVFSEVTACCAACTLVELKRDQLLIKGHWSSCVNCTTEFLRCLQLIVLYETLDEGIFSVIRAFFPLPELNHVKI